MGCGGWGAAPPERPVGRPSPVRHLPRFSKPSWRERTAGPRSLWAGAPARPGPGGPTGWWSDLCPSDLFFPRVPSPGSPVPHRARVTFLTFRLAVPGKTDLRLCPGAQPRAPTTARAGRATPLPGPSPPGRHPRPFLDTPASATLDHPGDALSGADNGLSFVNESHCPQCEFGRIPRGTVRALPGKFAGRTKEYKTTRYRSGPTDQEPCDIWHAQ
jgi:hypothetical protein